MVIGLKRESGTECHTDGKIKPGRPRRAVPIVVLCDDSVGGVGGVNQGAGDLDTISVIEPAVIIVSLMLSEREHSRAWVILSDGAIHDIPLTIELHLYPRVTTSGNGASYIDAWNSGGCQNLVQHSGVLGTVSLRSAIGPAGTAVNNIVNLVADSLYTEFGFLSVSHAGVGVNLCDGGGKAGGGV